ncbi:MAG TPA: hypothetical protein VGM03_16475 [Phycisphaerae bacterium]|jgi:hypothetical protein
MPPETSDEPVIADSEQRLPPWYFVLIVAAGTLALGFAGGAWITLRERSALQRDLARVREEASGLQRDLEAQNHRAFEGDAARTAAEESARATRDELSAARAQIDALERQTGSDAAPLAAAETSGTSAQADGTARPTSTTAPAVDPEPGRCTAITKSGTRCKRKAEPGTDRCWQHKRQS